MESLIYNFYSMNLDGESRYHKVILAETKKTLIKLDGIFTIYTIYDIISVISGYSADGSAHVWGA